MSIYNKFKNTTMKRKWDLITRWKHKFVTGIGCSFPNILLGTGTYPLNKSMLMTQYISLVVTSQGRIPISFIQYERNYILIKE